jgi:hypothetical protein
MRLSQPEKIKNYDSPPLPAAPEHDGLEHLRCRSGNRQQRVAGQNGWMRSGFTLNFPGELGRKDPW